MIKCEECISFAICVHKIIVRKYRNSEYIFDTTLIDDCIHFQERFTNRSQFSNSERAILKQKILEAKGIIDEYS